MLAALGPNPIGKGCLHLKRLEAVDLQVLENLLRRSGPGPVGGTLVGWTK